MSSSFVEDIADFENGHKFCCSLKDGLWSLLISGSQLLLYLWLSLINVVYSIPVVVSFFVSYSHETFFFCNKCTFVAAEFYGVNSNVLRFGGYYWI